MSVEVTQWCKACERCQVAKDTQFPPAQSFMGHLLASRPNEILAVDYTMLEPACNGLENVHVITDVFINVHWLTPLVTSVELTHTTVG